MPLKPDREYRAMTQGTDAVVGDYFLYLHTAPNGKHYVGITRQKSPEVRWDRGNGYKHNQHFSRAIEKYGWDNIEHRVLYSGLTETDAVQLERKLIGLYCTDNPKSGYNKTSGGERGKQMSRETREKIGVALKRIYATRDSSMKGKQHSAEAIKKMRTTPHALKGANNPRSKRVVQRDLSGEVIKVWGSCWEAIFGFTTRPIYPIKDCCQGRRSTNVLMGYSWEYQEVSA